MWSGLYRRTRRSCRTVSRLVCYAKNVAELNAESGSIRLADRYVAQAARIECDDDRLRTLTLADALTNLAEIKRLLLDYERRLLN